MKISSCRNTKKKTSIVSAIVIGYPEFCWLPIIIPEEAWGPDVYGKKKIIVPKNVICCEKRGR